MKNIAIVLIAAAGLAACVKKVDEEAARRPPSGKSGVAYFHDVHVDKCFYRASEWRMTAGDDGEVLVLRETECTDKLRAIAEKIGAPEAAP